MIKTAVIGASGYIGRHLWRSYRSQFPDCIGTAFSTEDSALRKFDIRNPDIATLQLVETGHEAVLIASAKPNIAYCENDKQAAYDVNVKGTLECLRQIGRLGLPAIFLSSDYVFEGNVGPYGDTDPTTPTTEYGRHKVLVERALPDLVDRFLILRLSKIYGVEKGDRTLLDEMASLLAAALEIQAAEDQLFCPTYIEDLVDVVHGLQARRATGTLNLCSPEGVSRYEIARALADAMYVDKSLVKAISLHSLPSMAGRPLDTRMSPSKLVMNVKPIFTPLTQHIFDVARSWSAQAARAI